MRQSHPGDRPDGDHTPLDAALLRAWPLPLDEKGDKLTRGTVLVIAGSTTTAGAALLAGTAALRMGAGRLQIATAAPIAIGLSIAMPEAMVLPLTVNGDDEISVDAAMGTLAEPLADAQAVLIGPGMFGHSSIGAILNHIAGVMAPEAVVVADAAAIRAVTATERGAMECLKERLVLTPNRQELEGLVEALDIQDVDGDLGEIASRELSAVVTCFGDVHSFDGRRWQAEPATPGLGTSGTGDVLAGLVVGTAARCGDPAQAACWATYVHGAAGNRLSERFGTASFIARELVDEIPRVMAELD